VNVFLALFNDFSDHIPEIIASLERDKFDEHGKVHASYDFNLIVLQKAKTQIGRSSSKHVRENHDTILLVDSFQALIDLLFRLLHIVVPANGNGFDVDGFTQDNGQGIQEFFSEFSVGYDDSANHLSRSILTVYSLALFA
jgi:hypothetical protein